MPNSDTQKHQVFYQNKTGVFLAFLPGQSPDKMSSYDLVVSVMWITSDIAYLHSAKGNCPAETLAAMVSQCAERGAKSVRTQRKSFRKMPRPWYVAEKRKGYNLWQIDV